MKPFFTNEILFTATEEEMSRLRVAVANMRWQFEDLQDSEDYKMYKQLEDDLTHIIEMLPF